MAIPDSALLLAGFVLAHGAWSASDLPKGELLCPLAVIETKGNRTLSRFEAETQEVAIARGKSAMMDASKSADAWAFVREGLMPEGGVKVDVLVVDFWAKGMSAPISIIQRFEPYSTNEKFKIIGEPKIVIDGVVQSTEKLRTWSSESNKAYLNIRRSRTCGRAGARNDGITLRAPEPPCAESYSVAYPNAAAG